MKKTALALTLIISAILSMLAIEYQIATILVKGNPIVELGGVDIVAPENKTYYSSTLILSYRATFPTFVPPESAHRWIVYSLDGGRNVTVYDEYNALERHDGSVTLSGLSAGNHTIDVYSKNGVFVYGSAIDFRPPSWHDAVDTVHFNIVLSGESPTPTPTLPPTPTPTATPETTSQPATFPATLVLVASVGIALAVIGLFVYWKKPKGVKNP